MEITPSPLVELTESLLTQARKGDRRAVREVLHGARLNLNGIITREDPPDQFGVMYLRFLLDCLERLLDKQQPASQAFRWATNSRPQAVSTDDKFKLFLEVGREYEEIMEIGSDKPIATAIKAVARRHKVSSETIRKSGWEEFGGSEGWRVVMGGLSEPD
jgi:hypothetical protein